MYSGVIRGRFLKQMSSKEKSKWLKGYLNSISIMGMVLRNYSMGKEEEKVSIHVSHKPGNRDSH